MSKIYILKITDLKNDTNWERAFAQLPTPKIIQAVVTKFLDAWKNDKEISACYSSWVGIDFTSQDPFNPSAVQQGYPVGPRIPNHTGYIKLTILNIETAWDAS